MSNQSDTVQRLSRLLSERAPRRTIIRASLGNGQGVVAHPTLDDSAFARLHDNDSTLVVARNLTTPMLDGIPVDIERVLLHSKVFYTVVGLTQGIQFQGGSQPYANLMLHAYTHEPGGYDPVGTGILSAVQTAVDYTVAPGVTYIGVTSTGAIRNIYLPDATVAGNGYIVIVKDEAGGASANNIRVTPIASQQVDTGGAGIYYAITSNRGSVMLIASGGNWYVIVSEP